MYDLVLTKALDLGVGSDLCPILCLRFRDSYFRPKIQLRSEFLAHYQLVLLVNLNCDILSKGIVMLVVLSLLVKM